MNINPAHDLDPDRTSVVSGLSHMLPATVIAERYELRDLIGSGAGGQVFEAYDRSLGRLVALKLMPVEEADSQEAAERFRRFRFEAQAVSRLSHPNIITVHDFGRTGGHAWIVMQLVIGETLKETLRQQGPLPVAEAVRLITALLDALAFAHGRGIVHRDVKPANILIEMSTTQTNGDLRLSDFGVARMLTDQQGAGGDMIGTPSVMAPEQVRGEAGDARIDIWAAGVILYEMLVGERPFQGAPPALFHRIETVTPAPPTSLRADLPLAFDAVIGRALAKRAEDRFASALEMAEAVRAALGMDPPAGEVPADGPDMPAQIASPSAPVAGEGGRPPGSGTRAPIVFLGGMLLGLALGGLLGFLASQA
ncbi:serine/threonine-protein kinase [Falsiroseomonas sp. HC035]|uniref:serine/threonine-protein kinase n=1 Tax=Falsiroseomonas sp. HC035 TaxID=3390999 RepID=UPI003D30F9A7